MEGNVLLKKAQALREHEHRLKPELRLKTLEDAVEFIHNKGLVSMLGGNELPSLVSALMGKPWKPSGKGFTSWLEWWNLRISGQSAGRLLTQLSRRDDIVGTRIFRNSKTYVSDKLWPILNPIIQHYHDLASKHMILSQLEWKILQTLGDHGPTRTDRLRTRLKLEGKQNSAGFHRALNRLDNHGLTVDYEDPKPERHLHAAIWHLWSQRVKMKRNTAMSFEKAISDLLERTLDACLFAEEKNVRKWFSWKSELTKAVHPLVAEGRIIRAGEFLFARPVA